MKKNLLSRHAFRVNFEWIKEMKDKTFEIIYISLHVHVLQVQQPECEFESFSVDLNRFH